jgi:hypothetical protein
MASRSGENFYNETGQSFSSNPASLKGKLQTLEVRSAYSATNQKHFQRAEQPQKGSANAKKRKGYSVIGSHHEDGRCEEKPFQ